MNKIICGDAVEIMKTFPDGKFDLIVTSPPYNIRNSSGNGFKSPGKKWANPALQHGYDNHSDNMPHDQYVSWQRECLSEMLRLIPDDGAIFYNHKWRVQKGLMQDRQDIVEGFPVRQIIIWHRNGGVNFNARFFLPTYEVIYLICKPGFMLKNSKEGDVWNIGQDRNNPHPASFPVELPRRIIRSTFARNVLDPFMGSGSTAIAAKLEGIEYTGIELSQTYVDMANKRIAEYNYEHQ